MGDIRGLGGEGADDFFSTFGGVGARGAGGDDGEGDARVTVGLYAVSAFVGGADDGEGAEHGVGDQGFEVRAPFAFQVGLADGGGLVGEAVLGKGPVVAGEEASVETRGLAYAFEVGGAVGGDNGGYEVGDGYVLGVTARGTGPFGYSCGGFLGAGQGGPGEDSAVGDFAAGAEHLVEYGGGVDGDLGVEGGKPEVEPVDVQDFALVGDLAVPEEGADDVDVFPEPGNGEVVRDAVLTLDLDLVARAEAQDESALEKWSRQAAAMAMVGALRTKTLTMDVPSLILSVARAQAVRVVNWSPPWPSESQKES